MWFVWKRKGGAWKKRSSVLGPHLHRVPQKGVWLSRTLGAEGTTCRKESTRNTK